MRGRIQVFIGIQFHAIFRKLQRRNIKSIVKDKCKIFFHIKSKQNKIIDSLATENLLPRYVNK